MNTITSAARVAESLAWKMYESDLNERDFMENKRVEKYEEITKDAGEKEKAVIWFADQSHENAELVESRNHALDVAGISKSNEAILEAAIGVYEMRNKAASMYAEYLVDLEFNG